ncbi:GGDEF domain-containing protein [Aquibium oceanicum]|uniref:diguanylate cyclase n=1 Tax=Aquibium oceanicum TaxID=1670800 RepID=A0A1L3SX99_9HYPH|nr:GGDEF domain-containing protein [Aquibium oceanicum]APH73942.1 GGDEF domain-containing protein [Aquibium oceanicum]
MNTQVSSARSSGGNAPTAPVSDIATKIALAMRAMGVIGSPRNYEIFYEVFAGCNPALNADLGALGNRPRQEDLDRLSIKYFIQTSNQLFVDNVREQIANKVEEVMILFDKERLQLERYGSILTQSSDGLRKRDVVTQEILQRIAGIMSSATDSKVEQGRNFANAMIDKSAELEEVKTKLEEYKRLADTDPMTQLFNRRAFDKAIGQVYDDAKKAVFSALMILDIDRFKQINDRYGHPVGDKIIQHVAGLIRTSASPNMIVARTGGEEFAVIVEGLTETAVFDFSENLRAAIEKLVPLNGQIAANGGAVTVSVGICMGSMAKNPEDLYAKADRALYMSKANGRNQTTLYSSLPDLKNSKNWLLYRRE